MGYSLDIPLNVPVRAAERIGALAAPANFLDFALSYRYLIV